MLDISLTSSIGIAQYPDSASAEQLLAHSTDAMQTARKGGRRGALLHEHGMDAGGRTG